MALKPRKESALNLTLEGSTGSFSVGTGRDGQNSLEVKYFFTHVGLDFSSTSDEALLSHLAPVREIFDFKQLDFDEIMQRDIDDARVSSELIPYLLDEKSVDLVKLFPPIVVVVLPVKEGEKRPADLYPKVYEEETLEQNHEAAKYILRAGAVGQEVFQFEQPIDEGQRLKHDLVRFRINTRKTRLVIVDGQHRAMALLAIYRNLKDQWSDEKRAPFKEYYSEWTPKYIQQFNLKEINLPVILCTFPSLNETYAGDFNLKKAARSIFLTLNKTARKVSNSRNILLDDRDIIAYFLRRCLSEVKGKDQCSPYSLRISNVELDRFVDQVKIKSPIAITGVNHLYYIIEHLLLNSGDEVEGVKPRSGKFSKRKDLNGYNCMDRLNGRNLLGSEVADLTTRDNFSQDSANKFGSSFDKNYGTFIIAVLERFAPYENHNKAALNLENSIEIYQDRQLRPILLEGQGIGRVFETHRDNLKQKFKDTKVPEIQSITQRLDATAKRIEQAIQDFRVDRTKLYVQPISDKAKLKNSEGSDINPNIVKWFNDLYDNVLTTVAFQSGLICGFFGEIEKTNTDLNKESQAPLNIIECFNEYIEQLNDFFRPKTSNQLKKLIRVFTGDVSGEIVDWKIISINWTFRNVVYSGEMQPDQWTKYKYLFLEIWKPKHPKLNENVVKERQKCREQIYAALHNYYRNSYCQEHSKLEENLEKDEMRSIFNQTFSAYSDFLKNLGAEGLNEQDMKVAVSTIPAKTIDEVEAEEEA